ncbi:DUF397 domain-containing protein [Streptomyces sp. NPDC093250]|uniref:DUF397 domain-containing protein n=1 Tax=unclassified Streptomyces TaxID=2593676 RepID=UPI0033D85B72
MAYPGESTLTWTRGGSSWPNGHRRQRCSQRFRHLPAAAHHGPLRLTGTVWGGSEYRGETAVVHEGRPLWERSSACGNEGECVEVAVLEGHVLARDSKRPAASVLRFTAPAWMGFLRDVVREEPGNE